MVLYMMYFVFKEILFDHMKACHHISPDQNLEKALTFLTSDVPSYDLSGVNFKIPDKPLSRRILDEDTDQIYREL